MNVSNYLKKLNACREAVKWAKDYTTINDAWNACHRGDWMLWFASKIKGDRRILTLAKGKCAETAIHLMKDKRSIDAVKAAIAYGNGEIDDQELKAAAAAAYAADADADADAADAYAAAAAYAADAYADAAYAYAAADAYADAAADAYAYAAAAYAYADAKANNQQKTADICREILTDEIMKSCSQS
jgi:hypothetical protein